jgi:large subunit ribosomal protein L29
MAKKKINYTELSLDELYELEEAEKLRLRKLKFTHAISALENPTTLRQLRREIARVKTEIRARELSGND